MLELAATTGRVFGVKPQLEFAPPRPGELLRSCLDAAKAGRVLGWRPEVSVEAGLPHLVEWFRREVAA